MTESTTEELEEDETQTSGVSFPAPVTIEPSQLPQKPSRMGSPEGLVASSSMTPPPGTSSPESVIHPNLLTTLKNCLPHPLFTIEQLGVDRRLLVNRKRQLKMYRVWMQGKFRKA